MAPSLVRRVLSALVSPAETKSLTGPVQTIPDVPLKRLMDEKASSLALLPKGAYGANAVFFSPDSGRTIIPIDGSMTGQSMLAFVAYWYVATRWRAQKIAEAPLMVVEESDDDGADEWLPDHELAPILDEPSPDYDMGELLECTSHYLDDSGAALWVFDTDGVGLPGRITPFSRWQFEPKSDGSRLFSSFRVQTRSGQEEFPAETCAFFRDFSGQTWDWTMGRSRLDVAISWLRLGATATKTIHDLLGNSIWPSAVIIPDKDWNPDAKVLAEYKQDIEQYAMLGNKGRPFIQLGGGQFVPLQSAIKDLVPDEVLNRVESVVAAISGVPAIVLQFEVGLQNSPWSQMAQARRMAYDDTIVPTWKKIERVLTRQMLRPVDEDDSHFIRFDSSKIPALQDDKQVAVSIAVMMGRAASLNERRKQMGLEPVDDPKADEIPELTQPSLQDILAGNAGGDQAPNNSNGGDTGDEETPKDEASAEDASGEKAQRLVLVRKFKAPALQQAFRQEAMTIWEVTTMLLLRKDAEAISEIVSSLLLEPTDTKGRAMEFKARGKDRVMSAVTGYLRNTSRQQWAKATTPLLVQAAERSTAVIAADMNISFTLLHKNTIAFASREAGKLVSSVTGTTKDLVSNIIQGGLDGGATTAQISRSISEATGFSKSRSDLIARTETTRVYNGAPTESLKALSEDTGRIFTKTWSGVLDDKERDEHVEMEGETVPIDGKFSNGLDFPSEPNCRCTVTYSEVEDE